MADYRQLAINLVAADRQIDVGEVRILRKHLYMDGKITHAEVEFLLEIKKKARGASAAFDRFLLTAVGDSILANNIISDAEVGFLKKLAADRRIDRNEMKRLLLRIKKQAQPNAKFDSFFATWFAKQ